MGLLILSWVVSLTAAYALGYQQNKIWTRVEQIQKDIELRRKPKTPERHSIVLDPDDPLQAARLENERRMRQLNPELYPDNK